MQERFEQSVRQVQEWLVDDQSPPEIVAAMEQELGGNEVAEDIVALQAEKQAVMEWLSTQLKQLDAEGTVGEEGKSRTVSYDHDAKQLYMYGKGGQRQLVTDGQLMTGGLWGESYFLDTEVPRMLKKRYIVATAKYQLHDRFDQQIARSEMEKSYNRNTGRDDAYAAIVEQYQSGEWPPGIIAERMVESFLTKLMHDHDVPYRIKSVTVYEDVEYKIDFIIEPLSDRDAFGVGVETPEARSDVGIQFTTARSQRTIEHKEQQLTRARAELERSHAVPVKDLVLVTLPLDEVQETYEVWSEQKQNRRLPGGPDVLWSEETKAQVFRALMERVLPSEVIERTWTKIAHSAGDIKKYE